MSDKGIVLFSSKNVCIQVANIYEKTNCKYVMVLFCK